MSDATVEAIAKVATTKEKQGMASRWTLTNVEHPGPSAPGLPFVGASGALNAQVAWGQSFADLWTTQRTFPVVHSRPGIMRRCPRHRVVMAREAGQDKRSRPEQGRTA